MSGSKPPLPALPGLAGVLSEHTFPYCLSNARSPDLPVIYASPGALKLMGRTTTDVLGRNCRFMQGKETERGALQELRELLQEERCGAVCLLNYRGTGASEERQPFWVNLLLAPVRSGGRVVLYVGAQQCLCEVGDPARPPPAEACAKATGEQEAAVAQLCSALQRLLSLSSGRGNPFVPVTSLLPAASPALPTVLLQPLAKLRLATLLMETGGHTIVFASSLFLRVTGWNRDQVLGCTLDLLEPAGAQASRGLARLKAAQERREMCEAELELATTTGRAPTAHVSLTPVRCAEGTVIYSVAVLLVDGAPGGCLRQLSAQARLARLAVCGAVRVACRSLACAGSGSLRRSCDDQRSLRRSLDTAMSLPAALPMQRIRSSSGLFAGAVPAPAPGSAATGAGLEAAAAGLRSLATS